MNMSNLPAEIEMLMTDWFRRVRESQRLHYECGTFFSSLNYSLGIPSIIFSTAVGTAVFASFENAASGKMRILVGLVSIFAAVLASLQTFLDFSKRADRHRLAGSTYGAIRRDLEYLKTFPPLEAEALKVSLNEIKNKMDSLAKEAPEVPSRLKMRLDAEMKSRAHRKIFYIPAAEKQDSADENLQEKQD
jgi:hypothetical protein